MLEPEAVVAASWFCSFLTRARAGAGGEQSLCDCMVRGQRMKHLFFWNPTSYSRWKVRNRQDKKLFVGSRGRALEDIRGRGTSGVMWDGESDWNPEQCCIAGLTCPAPFFTPIQLKRRLASIDPPGLQWCLPHSRLATSICWIEPCWINRPLKTIL